jgi:membrane-bound metal-dependent hydrolase YbcI (DUF457 family)
MIIIDSVTIWPFFKASKKDNNLKIVLFYITSYFSLIRYENKGDEKIFKIFPWLSIHSSNDYFTIWFPLGIFYYSKDKNKNSVTLGSLLFMFYYYKSSELLSFYMLLPLIILNKRPTGRNVLHIWPFFSLTKNKSRIGAYVFYPFFGVEIDCKEGEFFLYFPWYP